VRGFGGFGVFAQAIPGAVAAAAAAAAAAASKADENVRFREPAVRIFYVFGRPCGPVRFRGAAAAQAADRTFSGGRRGEHEQRHLAGACQHSTGTLYPWTTPISWGGSHMDTPLPYG
jgi:hypothetical protein